MRQALQTPAGTRDLNWYWAFGQGVRALRGDQDPSERYGWMTLLSAALGCSPSVLNKTRQFARLYQAREVERLAREGFAWGMVYPTFPVEGKREREAWMLRARDKHLSVHELERLIQQARQGPQNKGGRRRRELKSYGPGVDLPQLVRLCREWLNFHREVLTEEGTGLLAQLAGLPLASDATICIQLGEAERALQALVKAAAALKQQFHALQKKLNQSSGNSRG
jgi:hypothetical protein